MSLGTNPQHRIITAPLSGESAPSHALPWAFRAFRFVALAAIFLLVGYFLSVGTLESRVNYVIAFAISWINPVWGLYGLVLMGPLYLLDPGKTHLLAGVEVFVLGILAAELRRWGRPVEGRNAAGELDSAWAIVPGTHRVHWGVWPHLAGGLVLLLAASSLVGLQLALFQESVRPLTGHRWFDLAAHLGANTFYGAATVPEWTLKCFWNWSTAALLAMVAARHANPLLVARWLKLGGLGLLIACGFALLDWLGWLPLTHIRRANPDPLHLGRLQGTAGHAGWFAQWIVLLWPGLVLWWSLGRPRRNAVVAGALAVVGLALLLTAARASWLGAACAVVLGAVYITSAHPQSRRYIPIAFVAAAVVLVIAVLVGGQVFEYRLTHLLRAQDRVNYYVSSLFFLREHPFGLGLGTHHQFYSWMILPFYRWAQFDHVTAHSLWLHTLVENGPFVTLLIVAALLGIVGEVRGAWPRLDRHTRTILAALGLGLCGIFVASIAQYIAYIRIVEVSVWIGLGFGVGICRKVRSRAGEKVESALGRRLLLACGVAALLVASVNASRVYIGAMPRHYDRGDGGSISFWTGAHWRVPVNQDIDTIRFAVYRAALPCHVEVLWPDGTRESFRLERDESRTMVFERPARPVRWYERPDFLEVHVAPLFTPADHLDGSTDRRKLGVYIADFMMDSQLRREEAVPLIRY